MTEEWYAVQDSDWDWNSEDGHGTFVLASSPQEAASKAIKAIEDDPDQGPDHVGDGGNMKVARLELVGFIGFEYWKDIPPTWDEFIHISPNAQWTDQDQPLPEDEDIIAAHPVNSKSHDTYAEAMRLVGARRSKAALVDLVNWLLVRDAELRRVATEVVEADDAAVTDLKAMGIEPGKEVIEMTQRLRVAVRRPHRRGQ